MLGSILASDVMGGGYLSSIEGKPTCIDLFAGAGGLSEGLEEAGFHSLFASEIVDRYAETYKKTILVRKFSSMTFDLLTLPAFGRDCPSL